MLTEDTYQIVPSLLLMDLVVKKENGEPVLMPLDVAMYALLKAHAQNKILCWPSYECLGREINGSISTVQRSLRRLESAGHIKRKCKGKKNGKIYILTDVEKHGVIKRSPEIADCPEKERNPLGENQRIKTTGGLLLNRRLNEDGEQQEQVGQAEPQKEILQDTIPPFMEDWERLFEEQEGTGEYPPF